MVEADASGSLRDELRHRTAAIHRDLDTFVSSTSAFSTREGYRSFLIANAVAHKEIEACVEASSAFPPMKLPRPCRSELALHDVGLKACPGSAHVGKELHAATDAHLTGIFYVVEGASVGSRFLVHKLKQNQLVTGENIRFLSGAEIAADRRWKALKEILQRSDYNASQRAEAVEGAVAAFHHFFQVFKYYLKS